MLHKLVLQIHTHLLEFVNQNQNIQPPTPQQQPQIPDQGAGARPTPPPPNTQGSIAQNPAMYKALYPNDPLAQAIVEGRAGPRGYKKGGLVKSFLLRLT